MTKKETAGKNWEKSNQNEICAYETWLAHDKENKKLWRKYMKTCDISRQCYAAYLRAVAKEENK
jgi:hypothetical protein